MIPAVPPDFGMSTDQRKRQAADQRLFDTILAFAAHHTDRHVRRFAEVLGKSPLPWRAVPPVHLPAADMHAGAGDATPAAQSVLDALHQEAATRRWEQTYSSADRAVGAMLDGYGFTEIAGAQGPFVSLVCRAGIGVWGPNATYPRHRHKAEEVYVVLAGSATFAVETVESTPQRAATSGDAVHVPSGTIHALRTGDEPVALLYFWRGQDMREKSVFV